jgi:hypothetical protein
MGSDTHRIAELLAADDKGWSQETAGLVALALHPFDDRPVPMRAYEKSVRKMAKQNARGFRGACDADANKLARSLVRGYRAEALRLGEPYYGRRYDRPLGLEDGS